MNLISYEEALNIVNDIRDGNDKVVDVGIREAIVWFVVVTEALGFRTVSSCEGHADWGYPFPRIKFAVNDEQRPLPPLYKFWLLPRRLHLIRENRFHLENAEEKTRFLCALFTRLLVKHDLDHPVSPEDVLMIHRRGSFCFELLPARHLLSGAHKASSDVDALRVLLGGQRKTMLSFAQYCVRYLLQEETLTGVPEGACRGCFGRS